jgi:hypothetical protein
MGSTPIKSSAKWSAKVGGQNYGGTSPGEMARRNAAYAIASVEAQGIDVKARQAIVDYGVPNMAMYLAATREFRKAISAQKGATMLAVIRAIASKYVGGMNLKSGAITRILYHVFNIGAFNILLTSPNGGETWDIGEFNAVTWSGYGLFDNARIEISRDNGATWADVTASTPNNGSYTWNVTGAASAQCLIRVSDVNDPDNKDQSDAVFTIQAPAAPGGFWMFW